MATARGPLLNDKEEGLEVPLGIEFGLGSSPFIKKTENPALWTRSETDGPASKRFRECWSSGVMVQVF
jgi:hypothetical protein